MSIRVYRICWTFSGKLSRRMMTTLTTESVLNKFEFQSNTKFLLTIITDNKFVKFVIIFYMRINDLSVNNLLYGHGVQLQPITAGHF